MDYDAAYRQTQGFFGDEPEPFFVEHAGLIPADGIVLDVGAGQGRHTLFLARRDLRVHALDPSGVAVESIRKVAATEDLPVEVFHCGFESFVPGVEAYGAVLLCGILQEQTWEGIERLLDAVRGWTGEGSLVFLTAFRSDDPAIPGFERAGRKIDTNSYVNAEGTLRTYLEPGQILTLFPGYDPVYHHEGLGPEHRHGDGPPERHARIEAVFRRT